MDLAGKRTGPAAFAADHCAISIHAGLDSLEHLNRKTELLIKACDLFLSDYQFFRIDTLNTVDYTFEYIAEHISDMLRSSHMKKIYDIMYGVQLWRVQYLTTSVSVLHTAETDRFCTHRTSKQYLLTSSL